MTVLIHKFAKVKTTKWTSLMTCGSCVFTTCAGHAFSAGDFPTLSSRTFPRTHARYTAYSRTRTIVLVPRHMRATLQFVVKIGRLRRTDLRLKNTARMKRFLHPRLRNHEHLQTKRRAKLYCCSSARSIILAVDARKMTLHSVYQGAIK